jgi:hypothetical protein
MTDRGSLASGLAALLAGLALIVLGALGGPAATAQPAEDLTLTVAPAAGTDLTAPSVTTSAGCPTPANAYTIQLIGPNGLDFIVTGRIQSGFSNTDPFTGQFGQTFKDAAALDTPPTTIVAGTYTIKLNCVSGITGSTIVASFIGTVVFDTPTHWTFSDTNPTTTASSTTTSSSTTTTTTSSETTTDSSTTTDETTTTTTEAAVAANSTGGGGLAGTCVAPVTPLWIGLLLCFIGTLYLLAARRPRAS